jgi:peptidylprolyl isomerase
MKNSMLKVFASLACAAALAACGGGYDDPATSTPLPPQPVFTKTDAAVGSGEKAVAAGDLVTLHYTGYLYDDTKSDKKGAQYVTLSNGAVTVGVGAMLTGLDQGLIGMKAGGRRTLLIPASMAYGPTEVKDASGTKVLIPANTALVFDVEVLAVSTPTTTMPPQPIFTKTDTTAGTGTEAAANHLVTMHYTGYLYDDTKSDKKGAQFETSRSGSPFAFLLGVNSRIAGWDNGILGMKVGGKRTLLIPSGMAWNLAGRKDSAGNVIVPSNTAVVYEIEMTALNTQPPASTVQPAFAKIDDQVGTGTLAAASGDKLTVHYSGYLYNDNVTDKKGVRFDTSRVTGTPLTVNLGKGEVIAGWDQGLVGMKVGGKRTLIIPASMAYGSEAKGNIPANSALIFDVEVTSISR